MSVRTSGCPTGVPSKPISNWDRRNIYTLPHNEDIRIEYYLGQSYSTFSYTFYFVLSNRANANSIEDGTFGRGELTETPGFKKWNENIWGPTMNMQQDVHRREVMNDRAEIIQKLYDQFRLHMGIGTDDKMKAFFFETAYSAFFSRMDRPISSQTIIRPEPKPEPVDNTPPEVKSALNLHEKGIKLQKKIYRDTVEFQKEVSEHYKKYGTLDQRFIEYLKCFIPNI